jgi:beta-aspartyl-peptidase (threonine type)
MSDASGWSLILHGGAKEISPEEQDAHREGLAQALDAGIQILSRGGSALDAVEAAVRVLEDVPVFNAGIGAVKNRRGEIELDGAIMDGATLDIGAVAVLKGFRHPVSVARAMLREKQVLLAGAGAVEFARTVDAERFGSQTAERSKTNASDTVGCLARDVKGNLAVASSSGGLEGSEPGRVGDVCMPGCGFYADNQRGAVAMSGEGESAARMMSAGEALRMMRGRPVQVAAECALKEIDRVGGEMGIIAMTTAGEIGWAHTSPHFAVACATRAEPKGRIFLSRDELQ